jgi:lipopolysaccharide/colanic/teichoic acid biosynthesis glycosyltransferase
MRYTPSQDQIVRSTVTSPGRSLLAAIRFQLGIALFAGALLPYWIRSQLDAELGFDNLNYSLAGTIIAILVGYLGFRETSSYPGVRAAHGILPSFGLSYGLVIAVFLMFRIDYSRLQFLASFLICISWFYIVYRNLVRQRPVIGILPFGRATELRSIDGPEWVTVDDNLARQVAFDAIVADLHADLPQQWERFLADEALKGIPILHFKQLSESLTGKVEIEHLSENNLGSLIPGLAYARMKRALDVTTAIVLLPIFAVLLIPVAIAIKLDSPGSVFFTQPRVGYRGDLFTIFKLRTMTSARREADPRIAAMTQSSDQRVTRIGRFLRQYRIDELPQVLNILRGDMSWIGPRPEAAPLSKWYESELPFYRYRHIVRPGLSGWAQVNQGHVAEVEDVLWKLHYDFFYIRNFSFWLDVLIAGRTVRTILSGFGSR